MYDVTLSVYPHRAGLKLFFQACPVWIYTQSNITQASYSPEYITPTQQIYTISLTIYASSLSLWSFEHSGPMTPPPRLLARVLKEGVQFWYNDTSTVSLRKRSRKRSSGKPLKFTLFHVSICSKLVRNFSNTLGFVSLCRYASLLNCDIFIQPGTPSKCQMYNNNEN